MDGSTATSLATPRKAAVLGSPIAHSKSPLLHLAAYAALGLSDWTYERIECTGEQLPALVDSLGPEWIGLSVTMPGKIAALEYATERTPRAVTIGSANTLVRRADGWFADCTDIDGVTGALGAGGMGEVYRARDLNALTLLLEELGSRQLILIDTAGNDPMRQAQELAQLETPMALHAVMPADASFDQFRRLQSVKELKWASLMLSKADDLPNPWPMFGFLSAHPLPISAVSSSERSQEGLSSEGLNKLVRWAVDKLQSTLDQIAAAGIQTPAALPTRPATKTPARTTKPRVARTVKSKPAVAKTAAPIACLQ